MKKGMSDTNKFLFWIFFLIPVITVFGALILWAAPEIISIKATMSERLKDNMIHDHLLSSTNCFGYEENSNVKTGYIDLNKFNTETLNACLENYEPQKKFSLHLKFQGQEKELLSPNYQITARTVQYDRPVIVINNAERYNAILQIKMNY